VSVAEQLTAQGATAAQAAAIVAAIERYVDDTAAPAEPAAERTPWDRAGRLEAVGIGVEALVAWGDGHPWV
jgi:hypothetical protein